MKTKKILALALAAVLLVAVGVGGTLAYLQAQTTDVVNTFDPSNVGVKLEETGATDGKKEYQFVPGVDLEKDPTVTVTNDVTAYVYVKVVQEGTWPTANVTWAVDTDMWTKLNGVENVYYIEVAADASTKSFNVIKDNKVYVDEKLTNDQMTAMYAEGAEPATLTFTAYAMQKEPFTSAEEAWVAAKFQ